jgi:hypothetical protein
MNFSESEACLAKGGIDMQHINNLIQNQGGAQTISVTSLVARSVDDRSVASGQDLRVAPGATIEVSWTIDRTVANAVWLVRLGADGHYTMPMPDANGQEVICDDVMVTPPQPAPNDIALFYTVPTNQTIPPSCRFIAQRPGIYRLYAGVVIPTQENWCAHDRARVITIHFKPTVTITAPTSVHSGQDVTVGWNIGNFEQGMKVKLQIVSPASDPDHLTTDPTVATKETGSFPITPKTPGNIDLIVIVLDENNKELNRSLVTRMTVGPDPVGTIVFDHPYPFCNALVRLSVFVAPYYRGQVSLHVSASAPTTPLPPDDGRQITLDANGGATIFVKAPPTPDKYTYQIKIDGRLVPGTAILTPRAAVPPTGLLAFDDESPAMGAMVTLKISASAYAGRSLLLVATPKTSDDGRAIALDDNGDARVFITAPGTRGPFTYTAFSDDGPLLLAAGGDKPQLARAVLTPGETVLRFDWKPIVFDGGVPVGGEAHVTLYKDGTYTFSGRFDQHSGPLEYNIGLVWVIYDSRKTPYTFSQIAHVSGFLEAGPPYWRWDLDGQNSSIARNWAFLTAGTTQAPNCRANADFMNLFDSVMGAMDPASSIIQVVAPVVTAPLKAVGLAVLKPAPPPSTQPSQETP